MSDIVEFADREEFRKWLSEHCLSNDGVWLPRKEIRTEKFR